MCIHVYLSLPVLFVMCLYNLARYYVHVCGHTLQRGRLGTLLLPSLMLSLVHLRLFYTVSQLVMRTHKATCVFSYQSSLSVFVVCVCVCVCVCVYVLGHL